VAEIFISVVMPNLNGAKYLRRSLDAFLNQDYCNKELIVVDGMSSDKSHEILAEYTASYSSIRWLKEADLGISDAINRGIKISQGEIIGYLGSDDLLFGDIFQVINSLAFAIDFDAIYFNSYTYYVQERRCLLQRPSVSEITLETLLANGTIVMFLYVDQVATINYFDGNISHNNEKQMIEAAYVARRFADGYKGPLIGEQLLPEHLRRSFDK
jgi:glycosyltransferase involved in cell wall biosynthesis